MRFLLAALTLCAPAQGETWRDLHVAEERRCSPYDSRNYDYDRREWAPRLPLHRPYTQELIATPEGSDIEHIVARREAHDSGMCHRTVEERMAFANDPLNMTLADPKVNQVEKGGKDAGEWQPACNREWFAYRIVLVKQKYKLTVDAVERDALRQLLREGGKCRDIP